MIVQFSNVLTSFSSTAIPVWAGRNGRANNQGDCTTSTDYFREKKIKWWLMSLPRILWSPTYDRSGDWCLGLATIPQWKRGAPSTRILLPRRSQHSSGIPPISKLRDG